MSETDEPGVRIYHRGGQIERLPTFEVSEVLGSQSEIIAAHVPVTQIMSRDVLCARQDLPIENVIDLVVNNYIGCVPVVDAHGRPVGMITNRELVEPLANRVATAEESPRWCELAPQTAGEVMQRVSISLSQHATVSEVASLMALEYAHHVPIVTPEGTIAGLVSSLDVVAWLARAASIDANGPATSGRPASLQASRRIRGENAR